MPRRMGEEAGKIAAKGALARISYVIRNPRFQKELIEAKDQEAIAKLAERWGVVRIPVLARDSHLGKLIEKGDLKTLLEEMPGYIPKVELIRAYLFKAIEGPSSDGGPQYRETIELKIDLSYPLDVLEESFRNEVKKAKMERDQLMTDAGMRLAKRARLDNGPLPV